LRFAPLIRATLILAALTTLATLAVASGTEDNASNRTVTARPPSARAFALTFPAGFTVTDNPEAPGLKGYFPLTDQTMILGAYYSGPDAAGTNLNAAAIAASVTEATLPEDCAEFDGDRLCGAEDGVETVAVNDIPFRRATMEDAAMGHRLKAAKYWTVRDGRRYELRLSLSSTAIDLYPAGTKKEFDLDACWKQLTGIAGTFAFSPGGN